MNKDLEAEVIELLELCKMAGWRYTCSPAFFMRIDHILARLKAQTND